MDEVLSNILFLPIFVENTKLDWGDVQGKNQILQKVFATA